MKINKRLLPLKAHYFLFFGCMAPILPFVLVIAVQLGIPVPLQGSLSAFSLLFTIVGKPLVAALADIFPSYRKALFLATISIMVAAFSAIKFIPTLQEPISVKGTLVRAVVKNSPDGSFDVKNGANFITVSSSTDKQFTNLNDTISSSENDSIDARLHSQPLLLASDDDSGTYIASGWECSFVCGPSWFCPNENATTKVLRDYTYSQVVPYEISLMQKEPEISQDYYGVPNGRLYQLKRVNISWDFLKASVSIKCDGGKWNTGSDGQTVAWKSWQFWVLAVLLIVGQMAFNTAVSITDAITVDTVGDDGAYGVQRAWGTIGWGVWAPISGLLVDWWSESSLIKDYSPAFLLCFIVGAADVILSSVSLKVPKIKDESNILKNLWPLLKQPRFFIFCCFVVLNGCFDGVVVNYIFIMQEDMAKGTSAMNHMKFLQGLTVLVQGAVEAPFMFVYGWFMRKLGAQKVTSLVFFLYVFRLLGLYVVGRFGSVWATLIPELLNGPCFGLGYTAIVVYAARITPAGTSNTVQSVVNICYESFGYALAMFVGGLVYNQVGGPNMYLMAGGVAAVTFVCHIISLRWLPTPNEIIRAEKTVSVQQEIPSGASDDPEETRALTGEGDHVNGIGKEEKVCMKGLKCKRELEV